MTVRTSYRDIRKAISSNGDGARYTMKSYGSDASGKARESVFDNALQAFVPLGAIMNIDVNEQVGGE